MQRRENMKKIDEKSLRKETSRRKGRTEKKKENVEDKKAKNKRK